MRVHVRARVRVLTLSYVQAEHPLGVLQVNRLRCTQQEEQRTLGMGDEQDDGILQQRVLVVHVPRHQQAAHLQRDCCQPQPSNRSHNRPLAVLRTCSAASVTTDAAPSAGEADGGRRKLKWSHSGHSCPTSAALFRAAGQLA